MQQQTKSRVLHVESHEEATFETQNGIPSDDVLMRMIRAQ